jgi:hypothetical protein
VLIRVYWALASLSNENRRDLLERHSLHMPLWHAHIPTYEVREPPVLEDHTASVRLERCTTRRIHGVRRGLSMTECTTICPDCVRTSLVSAPHRKGRVASQPVLWASY